MTLRNRAPHATQRWITLAFSVTAAMLLVAGAVFATLAPSTFDAGDGNLVLNDDGAGGNEDTKDWENIGINCTSTPKVGCGLDLPTGQTDDSFGQGTKEDTAVPSIVGGSIPNNKSDLTRFYVANEKASAKDFLYLAWERVQEPNGTTNMDFEFNQKQCTPGLTPADPDCTANGVTPIRSAGDVLIKYDLSQGGVNPSLGYHTWVISGTPATVCEASNSVPCWGPVQGLTGYFEGAVNTAVVSDPIDPSAPRNLSARTFGEAAINLTDSNILPGGGTSCSGFGSAYLKSRSSDAFTSAVKDFIAPIPVNISNCGNIIIDKVTDPSGSSTVFDFNPSWSTTDFTLTDAGTPVNSGGLLAGNYSVTELAETGWDLTSASCSTDGGAPVAYTNGGTIALGVGETITCTFNNRQDGKIVVDKVTTPSGSSTVFDFNPSWSTTDFTLTDAGTPVDSGFLDPGNYSVTELAETGWDLTSASCSTNGGTGVAYTNGGTIALGAGETITCTFNNRQDGKIVVDKVTTPSGSSTVFDFNPSWSTTDFTLTDAGTPVDSGLMDPGNYSVTELAETGWDLTSASCSTNGGTGVAYTNGGTIALGAGETITCTFNNRQDGKIVVDKVTTPSGSSTVFDFNPSWSTTDFTLTDAGTPVDSGFLDPGNYSVTELAETGWDLTSASCSTNGGTGVAYTNGGTIALGAGETITCTFNNRQDGKIVVDKVTTPSGSSTVFDFNPSWSTTDFTLTDAGTPVDSGFLDPGNYSVTELAETGWDLTSASCSTDGGTGVAYTNGGTIALGAGETITCTFNNRQRGTINILKQDDLGNALQGAVFTLFTDVAPFDGAAPHGVGDVATSTTCTTNAAGECTMSNIVPGQYWVVETTGVAGYDLAADQNVIVGAGATLNLTFVDPRQHIVIVIVCHMGTNTLAPSDVTLGSDESTLTTSLSAPPVGITEAQLCGLGGARYPNISGHILNKLLQIDIGSDAH